MAVPSNPHVYLETMEAAEDEGAKLNDTRSTGRIGIPGRKHEARILVSNANSGGQHGVNKRKTDTVRLL